MSEAKDPLHENLSVLAKRLPRNAVRALVAELSQKSVATVRADQARRALISELNTPRPNRARRLFTSLVEFGFSDDGALFAAGGTEHVPGLIQRADIAGLWAALLSHGLAATANEIQARIDTLCGEMVIEDVFLLPEVDALRMRMASEAAAIIGAIDDAPPRQAKFLTALNDARGADIRARFHSEDRSRLSWKSVRALRQLLCNVAVVWPQMAAVARGVAHSDGHGPHDADDVAAVNTAVLAVERAVAEREARTVCAMFVVGVAVHRRQRYDIAAALLKGGPIDRDNCNGMLAAAICGHLAGVGREMMQRLSEACLAHPGKLIVLDEAARGGLDALLVRYGLILEAIIRAGLMEHGEAKFLVREAYGDLPKMIEDKVIDPISGRIRADAGAASRQVDHADIVRLSQWLSNWLRTVNRATLAGTTIRSWHDELIGELRREWEAAIRLDEQADRLQRMEKLSRIHELVTSLDGDTRPWLMVISVNTIAIIQSRLERPDPLTTAEAAIAANYLQLVEAEIKRTKHWKIPELVAFQDAARARLTL